MDLANMLTNTVVRVACLALLLLPAAGAQTTSAPALEGAVAPAWRWHVRGGGTARSGMSAAQPPRGPVTVAWERELGGTVEGDPLVWDQLVVVATSEAEDRQTLHLLDLATGAPLADPERFKTDAPLEPSVWDGRIALRTGSQRIAVLRRDGDELTELWGHDFDAEVGSPLLIGDELFVCVGDRLECHVLGGDPAEPRWVLPGRFRGALSLLGDELWLTEYDETGVCYLARVSVDGQRLPCRQGLGWHRDHLVLRPITGQGVSLLPGGVVAVSYGAYLTELEGKVRFALLRPNLSGESTQLALLPASSLLRSAVAAWGDGWLGLVDDGKGGLDLAWKARMDSAEYARLAGGDLHPSLVEKAVPATIAGGVALVGAHAFEVESGRMLWSLDRVASSRAVPVGERVLFAEGGSRLVCVVADQATQARSLSASAAGTLTGGTLVRRDGTVVTGDFVLTAGAATVEPARKTRDSGSWPLGELLVVADADGAVRWSAGAEPLARGMVHLVHHELAVQWAELAELAVASQDLDLSLEVLREAQHAGAGAELLEKARRDLVRLERKSRRSVSDRKVDEVRARRAELADLTVRALWQAVESLPKEASDAGRMALVLAVLAEDPGHAAARRVLVESLPAPLRSLAADDPLAWAPLVATAGRWPLTAATAPDDTPAGQALAAAAESWRPDLLAVAGPQVVVVAASTAPALSPVNLARALTIGELTAEALGALLPELADADAPGGRLVIRLYPNSRDYLVLAEPGDQGTEAGLGWRTAHDDAAANVCHLALPDTGAVRASGAGEWPEVVADSDPDRTLAHHLARQWLRRHVGGPGPNALAPGLWLEVGVAGLADELEFDGPGRSWVQIDGLTPRAELLASVPDDQVMPWATLMNMSAAAFASLERQLGPVPPVPSSVVLGPPGPVGRRNLFYSQAAALVRALLADDAARPEFVEALRAYVSGDDPGLSPASAFGAGAEARGQQARERAQAAAQG